MSEGAVAITREECPECHYVMTKPFEYRCPICLKQPEDLDSALPIDPEVLLSVKPLPKEEK